MEKKQVTLGELAQELSLSIYTLLEFLTFKTGKIMDADPNLTLDDDLISILRNEFADEGKNQAFLKGKADPVEDDQGYQEMQDLNKKSVAHLNQLLSSISQKGISVYAVGADWGGTDRTVEFLKLSIWENGDPDEWGELVNKVNKNDLLVLKSTYASASQAFFRVKAIGKVLRNKLDGTRLEVEWFFRANNFDIVGNLAKYRKRLALMPLEDLFEILTPLREADKLSADFDKIYQALEIPKPNQPPKTDETTRDRIRFHLDGLAKTDYLNRKPIAKSLARLINNDIFSVPDMNHAFMVHLQGEWGAGKSSFLEFLENELNAHDEKWIAIKFNAWQNQHIQPPWWTLLNQIYLQSLKSEHLTWWDKQKLKVAEKWQRLLKTSFWQKLLTGLLFVAIAYLLIFMLYPFLADIFGKEVQSDASFSWFSTLITTLVGLSALIFSFSKFLATPFYMRNSKDAKTFIEKADDPMQSITSHFENLVSNIQKRGIKLAIFIDDLDRCNQDYVIDLLEGIQTLFKNKPVLYLVAGEKNWITTCFQNKYSNFAQTIPDSSQKLGDLFLEKAFQLSVRLPQISNENKQKYWNYILGEKEAEVEKKNDADRKKIIEQIKEQHTIEALKDPQNLATLKEAHAISEAELLDITLEIMDSDQSAFNHALANIHELIVPNPRVIKRLANEYSMYRNILIVEKRKFNTVVLLRWIILETKFPTISQQIKTDRKILDEKEELLSSLNQQDKIYCEKLIFSTDTNHGGALTSERIEDILGVSAL